MQLPKFLDEYTFRARLFPALIAAASSICAFFVLIPWKDIGLPQLAATLASGVLLYALADLARRQGKRIEPGLYRKWGGKPSTLMLRHNNTSIDGGTKARYLTFLSSQITERCPTAAEENANLVKADEFYERCCNWLRETTRDTKKFKILFDENITYGYRRNLLALKYPALIIDALIIVACMTLQWWRIFPGVPVSKLIFVTAFALLHALYIMLSATERGVREAANQYARQLLLSCESLISRALPRRSK